MMHEAQGDRGLLPALTICQPYAHLITEGAKWVENRTWPSRYRGFLLIHAGKSHDWLNLDASGNRDETYQIHLSEMVFGKIVAVARLADCIHKTKLKNFEKTFPGLNAHVHAEGPFCWVLTNIHRLVTPIEAKGKQGTWNSGLTVGDLGRLIEVKPHG